MGKKTGDGGKAKEKRLKKKEEQQILAAKQALVDAANAQADPMERLQPFKKFYRNGVKIDISCHRSSELEPGLLEWAFELTKSNMQMLYESSGWGWNEKEKREEMADDKAWYLVARDADDNNNPVGMVHFRFDLDDGDEVLYCYEIQLVKAMRQKGVGRFMMQILEMLAFQNQMTKVVLTVIKCNTDAQNFFRNKLKYELDETNPEDSLVEAMFTDNEYPYHILSKKIGQKKS